MEHLPVFRRPDGGYDFGAIGDRVKARNKILDNLIGGVTEGMRRARRLEQINKHFAAPFVEDIPEVYIGYKGLNLLFTGQVYSPLVGKPYSTLVSPHDSTVWHPEGIEAQCHLRVGSLTPKRTQIVSSYSPKAHPDTQIPHPMCTCGIYAYDDLEYLRSQHFMGEKVIVEVALGGHVLPHSKGYRAQIAKITAIYTPRTRSLDVLAKARNIANYYRVELRPRPFSTHQWVQYDSSMIPPP